MTALGLFALELARSAVELASTTYRGIAFHQLEVRMLSRGPQLRIASDDLLAQNEPFRGSFFIDLPHDRRRMAVTYPDRKACTGETEAEQEDEPEHP